MVFTDFPQIIVNFLSYKLNIQGRSQLTVNEYAIDLRCFFKYIIALRTGVSEEKADISIVDAAYADGISSDDIYGYLLYLAQNRKSKPTTRSRKLATIRSFYKYHTTKSRLLKNDPAKDVDAPRLPIGLPIVMTMEESLQLLPCALREFTFVGFSNHFFGFVHVSHEHSPVVCGEFFEQGVSFLIILGK